MTYNVFGGTLNLTRLDLRGLWCRTCFSQDQEQRSKTPTSRTKTEKCIIRDHSPESVRLTHTLSTVCVVRHADVLGCLMHVLGAGGGSFIFPTAVRNLMPE